MFEKVKEIFKEIDEGKRKKHESKIFLELENSYSFRDIINIYNDNHLYDDFSMKVWIFPDKNEDKLFAFIHRNKDSFEFDISYIYPSDKKKDRNFHTGFRPDDISNLPAIDESVLNVEFFYSGKANLEYTFFRNRHPQLNFVESDVYLKNRLKTAGVRRGENAATITVIDEKMSSKPLIIKYLTNGHKFTIKGANRELPFICTFNKIWRYSVGGKEYEDIEKVFDIFWNEK